MSVSPFIGKTKKRKTKGVPKAVDDLLKDIDELTKSFKVGNTIKKVPKKEIFRVGSFGYRSGNSAKRRHAKKKKLNQEETNYLSPFENVAGTVYAVLYNPEFFKIH